MAGILTAHVRDASILHATSATHLALGSQDGSVRAMLDGALYNRPALVTQLRTLGHEIRGESDAEVVTHLYEEYGPELVHAIDGMYALALWDGRRQRLLLARDRFGEKPLFYVERAGNLWFASELNALRAGGAVSGEVNPDAVDAYFRLGFVPGPATMFDGVSQLPPGHLLCWERASRTVTVRRYWEPPPPSSRRSVATDLPVGETRALLEAAVRCSVVPRAPASVVLSGAIGATLLATVAAVSTDARVRIFAVGWRPGDLAPARRLARLLRVDHHEAVLEASDVAKQAPGLLGSLDQPLADPALIGAHALGAAARPEVAAALGAAGAAELFAGRPSGRHHHAADPAPMSSLRRHLYGSRLDRYRGPAGPAPDGTLASVDLAGPSMGLEVRSPYLARSLAELACTLPVELHSRGSGSYLLRRVLEGVLRQAAAAPDRTVRPPAGDWLRGPLAPVLFDLARSSPLFVEGWFERRAVSHLVGEHLGGSRDRSPVLWRLLVLSLWLERRHGHAS